MVVSSSRIRGHAAIRSSWAFASLLSGPHPAIRDLQEQRLEDQEHEDPETLRAIENICNLYEMFDGSDRDEAQLYEAFARTFDKNATGLTYSSNTNVTDWSYPSNRVELNFDQIFSQDVFFSNGLGRKIEMLSVQRLLKGLVEYSTMAEFGGYAVMMRTLAFVENGQIMRLERQEATFTVL